MNVRSMAAILGESLAFSLNGVKCRCSGCLSEYNIPYQDPPAGLEVTIRVSTNRMLETLARLEPEDLVKLKKALLDLCHGPDWGLFLRRHPKLLAALSEWFVPLAQKDYPKAGEEPFPHEFAQCAFCKDWLR